jgi:hypothetical protein
VLFDLIEEVTVDLSAPGFGIFFHVDMENLDAIEPHERSLLDAIENGDRLSLEMPEGIRGDADAVRPVGHSTWLGLCGAEA